MSSKKQPPRWLIRKIFGVPEDDWAGEPGKRFRKGLGNTFKPSSNGKADELSVNLIEDKAARAIESAFISFNRSEDAASKDILKRLQEANVRSREAEARKKELENLEVELRILKEVQAAGVVVHYVDGKLTIFPTESSLTEIPSPDKQNQEKASDDSNTEPRIDL